MAGNVFVRCDKGIRVLNAADVHVYNNTFVDTPASFERNERSATGDHFGWHPATGPDVDQREGHVFVNNLLVAERGLPQAALAVRATGDALRRSSRARRRKRSAAMSTSVQPRPAPPPRRRPC